MAIGGTKFESVVWKGLLDYGLLEWKWTMLLVQKHPKDEERLWEKFEKVCCPHDLHVGWSKN
jgi:hypothetical protein